MTSCFDDMAGSVEEKSQLQDLDMVSSGDKPDLEAREAQAKSLPECSDADVVWDGWDAALLRRCGITKKVILGKRKSRRRGEVWERDGKKLSADEAFQAGIWSAGFKEGKPSDKIQRIAKAVAALVNVTMLCFFWKRLEDLLPAKVYKAVRRSIFSSFAKFVLTVFDLEDFERICDLKNSYESYPAFVSKLQEVESGSGPLVSIAKGRMDVAEFSDLSEHEVGEILQTYEDRTCQDSYLKGFSWDFDLWPGTYDAVKPGDVKRTMKEMQEYVPLMEEYKMQLTLELMCDKGFCVLDTLFLEAWKGLDLQPMFDYFSATLIDERTEAFRKFEELGIYEFKMPVAFANNELYCFVNGVKDGLFRLARFKQSALRKFQAAAAFPITCGVFGNFADEVLEVVKIANHRRRMEGVHFISVHHILFGLLKSRVGDTIESILPDAAMNCFAGNPSKFPLYNIYMKSGDAARARGEEVVRLEHFALAVIWRERENNLLSEEMATDECTSLVNDNDAGDDELYEILRKADTKCSAKIFKCEDWKKFVPEQFFHRWDGRVFVPTVQKLIEAFRSGLKLPAIRWRKHVELRK